MASTLIGFDPGRDKCGLARVRRDRTPLAHKILAAAESISCIAEWIEADPPELLVMGDGTTTKAWQTQLRNALPDLKIVLVDERNSTLEARDRYWDLYPPHGLQRLVPRSLRQPPRPVDDIVAILLVERYLAL